MRCVRAARRFDALFFLFLLAVLAFAFHPQKSFAATKVVTDDDKGSDVQIKLGDTLEVRLASNPSTGYMWYVHPKSTALLKLTGQTQTDAAEPGVGRPIVQVFTFQPKRAGDGILLLRYVRSWEKPALGEEQFMLHVVIE
jgi:inhibitor of cysteine peptidase